VSGPLAWPVTAAIYSAGEWLWLIAFLGFASRLLDRIVPYLTGFTRYAFPFYIAHQAIIVWLGWLTFGWQSMPFAKYLTIAVLAAVISYAVVRLLDLIPPARFLIGLKTWPTPRPMDGTPAAPVLS
jgi:surface polysaccharide O-acyltransferase-like enzyme